MKFHYDMFALNGGQIDRDVLLYDAASIAKGELVMLGSTDPDSNADHGVAYITAYTGDSSEAVDALGVCLEDVTPTTLPGGEVAGNYGKVTINPGAVYLAEYSQAAANDIALTEAWSTTTLTITSLEDDIDTGWIYGSSQSSTSGFEGQLRYIAASASGSCTLSNAPTTAGTTSDTVIKILPVNHRLTALTADATGLLSDAAAGSGVSLHIVENYIQSKKIYNMTPLRRFNHSNLDSLNEGRFYADVALLDHVYNNA